MRCYYMRPQSWCSCGANTEASNKEMHGWPGAGTSTYSSMSTMLVTIILTLQLTGGRAIFVLLCKICPDVRNYYTVDYFLMVLKTHGQSTTLH